jgi:hypothetical protein
VKRPIKVIVPAVVTALSLAWPAGAGAETRWVCEVPGGETVVFVSAADAALHGITQANSKAGAVFNSLFGENCRVENP